jgi:hypothetical protein
LLLRIATSAFVVAGAHLNEGTLNLYQVCEKYPFLEEGSGVDNVNVGQYFDVCVK